MPKKKEKGRQVVKSWVCGCGVNQPYYILYCPKCKKGQ